MKKVLVVAGLSFWQCADDIGISSISDWESADAEVFTASCSELDVVAVVVVNSGLSQHSVVLDFGFSKGILSNPVPEARRWNHSGGNSMEARWSADYLIAFPPESYFSVTEMTPYGSSHCQFSQKRKRTTSQ